jgi:predicted transcriptional regulator YheO
MPQPNRGPEIIAAIREHLKSAETGAEPITDQSLMVVANCSRKTFYKYVTEDSEIENEIKRAYSRQREHAGSPNGKRQKESELIISQLREELDQTKKGNRNLLEHNAQVIANLKSKGVPDTILQWAQKNPMPRPDRRVTRAGRSRRRTRSKR